MQRKVAQFWQLDRPVGAICHGVLVLARTIVPETGVSVLNGMHATCLPEVRGSVHAHATHSVARSCFKLTVRRWCHTWQFMEQTAYGLTCCCRGRYYRTYRRTVQDEVTEALGKHGSFFRGPFTFTRCVPLTHPSVCVVDCRGGARVLIRLHVPGDAGVRHAEAHRGTTPTRTWWSTTTSSRHGGQATPSSLLVASSLDWRRCRACTRVCSSSCATTLLRVLRLKHRLERWPLLSPTPGW